MNFQILSKLNFMKNKMKMFLFLPIFLMGDVNAYLISKDGCINKHSDKYNFTGEYRYPFDYEIVFEAKGKYSCDFLDNNQKTLLGCTNGMKIQLLDQYGRSRNPNEDVFFTRRLKLMLNQQELGATAIEKDISKNFKVKCDFKKLKNKISKETVSNTIEYKLDNGRSASINYVFSKKIIFK